MAAASVPADQFVSWPSIVYLEAINAAIRRGDVHIPDSFERDIPLKIAASKTTTAARKVSNLHAPAVSTTTACGNNSTADDVSAADAANSRCIETTTNPSALQRVLDIPYRGKIKLHGMNCAVNVTRGERLPRAQSRRRFLSPDIDSTGFASWVSDHGRHFVSAVSFAKKVVVFGEWCGPGINRYAAVCDLDVHIFVVFGIVVVSDTDQAGENRSLIAEPADIYQILSMQGTAELPPYCYVAPWVSSRLSVRFKATVVSGQGASVTALAEARQQRSVLNKNAVQYINALVDVIDREDPWVKKHFGFSGVGEGVVFFPQIATEQQFLHSYHAMPLAVFINFAFKAKGETHRDKRAHVGAASMSVAVAQSVEEFCQMFVTMPRLRQAQDELGLHDDDLPRHLRRMEDWMVADIRKESHAEFRALVEAHARDASKKKTPMKWGHIEAVIRRTCSAILLRTRLRELVPSEHDANNRSPNFSHSVNEKDSSKRAPRRKPEALFCDTIMVHTMTVH